MSFHKTTVETCRTCLLYLRAQAPGGATEDYCVVGRLKPTNRPQLTRLGSSIGRPGWCVLESGPLLITLKTAEEPSSEVAGWTP